MHASVFVLKLPAALLASCVKDDANFVVVVSKRPHDVCRARAQAEKKGKSESKRRSGRLTSLS